MTNETLCTEKFLDMSDTDIDNLLFGINLEDSTSNTNNNLCRSCNSDSLVFDTSNGYNICDECGVVNDTILDKHPEFNKEDKSASYGCPTNYFYPKSALGTKIKIKGWNKISSLQRQGQMPYKEKSLMDVLNNIQQKCKNYGITQTIIDSAKILYKKINDSKHTKGRRAGKSRIMRCVNRRSMIAACVFYACKIQNEPRSPKEIADIYDLEIKNVNRGCRKFLDYIDIEQIIDKFSSSQASDFIERFGKKLDLQQKYIDIAKDISINILKLDLASTHEPPSVAAGCILLVSNEHKLKLNKKYISEVFNISDVTISKTYRRLYPYHKIIMNNEITKILLSKKKVEKTTEINITKDNLIISK
uniref:Transcription factor TFIIB repeat n=1 Tax=Megaviridae environmental sample TaxID=1737588 RepID=A0A5J6VKN9_9VIRU|nr:MAG: transcription factor TFIIB repeat [Megaviridae environmental sample]